ncbi:cellobiose phosphorylase [Chloroflexota bacterium]
MVQKFDEFNRYVIRDYSNNRPFASFLPGIAGPTGIPLWAFYVNRGQAITSFGVTDKNSPIMEFQPANKAYQTTPYTGFRTFFKFHINEVLHFYEPFAPWNQDVTRQMCIGINELELQEYSSNHKLRTNILYFTLPGESFAGLVRSVTLRNCGEQPISIEILDGMPAVIPFGVNNFQLKEFGRTIEAWMEVYNLEQNIPFYRVRASIEDDAKVETFKAGHFSMAFTSQEKHPSLCSAYVDPRVIFAENTTLSAPDHFKNSPLDEITQENQITCGRTPCSFFGGKYIIEPSSSITIHSIYGHVSSVEIIDQEYPRLISEGYIAQKRVDAQNLALDLTAAMDTSTNSPIFDAYCRQTYLDNILRGGYPQILQSVDRTFVYHIFSRKHGDTERDYNAFYLAPEYYSQGNGNYRDVNQNRRSDVLFNPEVAEFNIHSFMNLIQADGYNPLVVKGSKFTLPLNQQKVVLEILGSSAELQQLLSKPFSPGELLKIITDNNISLAVSIEDFLRVALQNAEQVIQADFHEGYWVDHWTYNLDLIESFLNIFPEKKENLLFGDRGYPFYDSEICVNSRDKKYVLLNGQPHQINAIFENPQKKAIIESRENSPFMLRTHNGRGEIYYTNLISKLLLLALIKFATLDPWGMGIEMEAGRPGWYDALNGLPGLFGASMPETFELKRLLEFLLKAIKEYPTHSVEIPIEANQLLETVLKTLSTYQTNNNPDQDYVYWDAVSSARELYRTSIQLGIQGQNILIPQEELAKYLGLFIQKVDSGIQRALEINANIPPTYFYYRVDEYEFINNPDNQPETDPEGWPNIRVKKFTPILLPLFLEGFVRALKVAKPEKAQTLYQQVKTSTLYDQKLKMYKVNSSLENQPFGIGRARAFTPGWLENESIWLHMEYKYLLEVLKARLYEEFFEDFRNILIPFLDPKTYGRSPTENSSFLVSSAHPDPSLHGVGFVARLSGSTAEFLSIWNIMMAGETPFFIKGGQLCLQFKPILPGWLFNDEGKLSFRYMGNCWVTYHNNNKQDTYDEKIFTQKIILQLEDKRWVEIESSIISSPFAEMVRIGEIKQIDVFLTCVSPDLKE